MDPGNDKETTDYKSQSAVACLLSREVWPTICPLRAGSHTKDSPGGSEATSFLIVFICVSRFEVQCVFWISAPLANCKPTAAGSAPAPSLAGAARVSLCHFKRSCLPPGEAKKNAREPQAVHLEWTFSLPAYSSLHQENRGRPLIKFGYIKPEEKYFLECWKPLNKHFWASSFLLLFDVTPCTSIIFWKFL